MLMVGGCASAKITTTTNPDGTASCEASYTSAFKDAAGIKMSACDAKGDAQGTSSNTELLKAVLSALIK